MLHGTVQLHKADVGSAEQSLLKISKVLKREMHQSELLYADQRPSTWLTHLAILSHIGETVMRVRRSPMGLCHVGVSCVLDCATTTLETSSAIREALCVRVYINAGLEVAPRSRWIGEGNARKAPTKTHQRLTPKQARVLMRRNTIFAYLAITASNYERP